MRCQLVEIFQLAKILKGWKVWIWKDTFLGNYQNFVYTRLSRDSKSFFGRSIRGIRVAYNKVGHGWRKIQIGIFCICLSMCQCIMYSFLKYCKQKNQNSDPIKEWKFGHPNEIKNSMPGNPTYINETLFWPPLQFFIP